MLLKLVDLFSFFSVVLRAGTLVFQSVLLGGILFGFWIARASPEAGLEGIGRVQASTWRLLRIGAVGLVVMQLLYLYVNSVVLMGTAELGFSEVIGANFFISGCIVLTAALVIVILGGVNKKVVKGTLPLLALVVMGGSVMTNHAASRLELRPLLVTLSCIHELATGFWIGGLPFLVLGLFRARDSATRWYVTERFSRIALVSVAALVTSGITMSVIYIGSWRALFGTSYGVMVLAKATMLGALLLIGGLNFLLIRSGSEEDAMLRLRRLIEAEVGIGITVILTAASLTAQPPAVDQVDDTLTFSQIYHRVEPVLPRLKYAYVLEPANARKGGPKPGRFENKIVRYNVDGILLTPVLINNAIESESNHHWMGLVVFSMGVLALVARARKMRWASYWPLLLIAIAAFIFIQADSECWPVGWKSFGACWIDPEAFQHRIAALLCAGFGIFEMRVRNRSNQNRQLALVFPLLMALGGAVLLTHSHAIKNVKESTLVELSHVPMGIIAVFSGWSRWLELRLPEKNRAIPSLIWPVCFVLIGALLLNYREM